LTRQKGDRQVVDIGDAYLEVQNRLIQTLEDAGDLQTSVPACPGWSVHDVLAHHVGVVAGIASGDLGEFGALSSGILEQWRDVEIQRLRDAMTARQVEDRRLLEFPALCGEWRAATTEVLPMMRGEIEVPPTLPPFVGFILVNDVVVHETDIRAALELPRASPSAALSIALSAYSFSLENRVRTLGLPALVMLYDDKERWVGDAPAGASVKADRHELLRVLAGRRTRAQILELEWTGDPNPYLDVLSEYGPTMVGSID
jgi:uncharacterized protein (TIGR03083 family)